MKTDAEILDLARRVSRFEIAFDMAGPLDELTHDERRRVLFYALYELRRKSGPAQRKALMLFRSWLTDEQRDELRRREFVTVVGSSGGVYRVRPRCGQTERVERHGKNWYRVAAYCYHDEASELPQADIALAHLLLLSTDEPRFRAEANETTHWPQCWDSEWMRRRAEIRRCRVEQLREVA